MAKLSGVNAKVFSGTTGAVQISGAHNWSDDDSVKLDDATDYATGAWEEDVTCNRSVTVTIELYYDDTQNIRDTTPETGANLVPGATNILGLYVDGTHYVTGTFHIQSLSIAVPQGAKITQTVKAKLQGVLDESHL